MRCKLSGPQWFLLICLLLTLWVPSHSYEDHMSAKDIFDSQISLLAAEDNSSSDSDIMPLQTHEDALQANEIMTVELSQTKFDYKQADNFSVKIELATFRPFYTSLYIKMTFPPEFNTLAVVCFSVTVVPLEPDQVVLKSEAIIENNVVTKRILYIQNIPKSLLSVQCHNFGFPPYGYYTARDNGPSGWVEAPIVVPLELLSRWEFQTEEAQFHSEKLIVPGSEGSLSDGSLSDYLIPVENTQFSFTVGPISPINGVHVELGNAPNCVASPSNQPRYVVAIAEAPVTIYVGDVFEFYLPGAIQYFYPDTILSTDEDESKNPSPLSVSSSHKLFDPSKTKVRCRLRYFTPSSDSRSSEPTEHVVDIETSQLLFDIDHSKLQFVSPIEISLEQGLYLEFVGIYPVVLPDQAVFQQNSLTIYEKSNYRKLFLAYDTVFCDTKFGLFAPSPLFDLMSHQVEPNSGPESKVTFVYALGSTKLTRSIEVQDKIYLFTQLPFNSDKISVRINYMEISQSSFSIFPYPFSKSSFVLYFVKSVGNRGDDFQLTVTYTTKQKKVAEFDGNNPFVLSLTSETKLPNFTNIRSFALEARSPGGPMKIAQTEFIINVSVTDLKVLRYRHYNATERQQLVNIVENLVRGTASNETVRCIPMRVDVETPISNQSPVRSRGTIKIACMGVERLDLVSQAIEKQRKIISMKLFSTNRLLFSAHATFTTMSPECFAMTPRPGSSDKFWRFDICGQAQDKKCVRTLCDEGLPCSTHQDCISAFCDPKKIDPQWGARPFSFPALLSSISTFNDQEGICRDANYRPDEGTETSDDGDGSDSSDGTDKDTKPGSLYKILLIITGSIVFLLVSMYVYYRLNLYCQRYKMRRRQDEELRERMLDDEIEYDRYQYNEQDLVDYYDVFKSGT